MRFDRAQGSQARVAGNLGDGQSLLGFGDAWVLLVDFAEPVTGWSVLAYGQTTNPASRHSADQIRIFASHELRRAWYTETEIKEHTTREYRPGRADGRGIVNSGQSGIVGPVEYLLKQYSLHQGALEIQYIEEFFLDFPRKKTAAEVIQRLGNRDHQILMAEAPLPNDPGTVVPVSFKVAHELRGS